MARLDRLLAAAYHRINMSLSNNVHARLRESPETGVTARAYIAVAALGLVLCTTSLRAQQPDEHKRKVPVLDKLTTTNGQDAFSGSVQSLDWKTSLLLVHSTRDDNDEYFPVKKSVHVATADGLRVGPDRLKPGVSVLVYYEEKGDRRAVKEIILLGGPAATPKAKSTPPS